MGRDRETGTTTRWLRPAAAAGLCGGAWGVLVDLGALEVIGRGPLQPVDGRAGQVAGLLALWAIHDPFADEIRWEREARERTHGRPE